MPASRQVQQSLFSGPIPGQSWTHEPKSMPWENPPQHVKVEDTMHFLMAQLMDTQHLKALLNMMDAGMPLEAIARTILFSGFTMGKWTPDLAVLMYKPLMMTLLAIAHKAGLKHTPVVMKENLDKFLSGKLQQHRMFAAQKEQNSPQEQENQDLSSLASDISGNGFMSRRG